MTQVLKDMSVLTNWQIKAIPLAATSEVCHAAATANPQLTNTLQGSYVCSTPTDLQQRYLSHHTHGRRHLYIHTVTKNSIVAHQDPADMLWPTDLMHEAAAAAQLAHRSTGHTGM